MAYNDTCTATRAITDEEGLAALKGRARGQLMNGRHVNADPFITWAVERIERPALTPGEITAIRYAVLFLMSGASEAEYGNIYRQVVADHIEQLEGILIRHGEKT